MLNSDVLMIVLLTASLLLFLATLLAAVLIDMRDKDALYTDITTGNRLTRSVQLGFRKAARRPVRILGTFLI